MLDLLLAEEREDSFPKPGDKWLLSLRPPDLLAGMKGMTGPPSKQTPRGPGPQGIPLSKNFSICLSSLAVSHLETLLPGSQCTAPHDDLGECCYAHDWGLIHSEIFSEPSMSCEDSLPFADTRNTLSGLNSLWGLFIYFRKESFR